ncbi:hypothetical protein AB0H42_07885 [Nocardia sp. NPDC050799]|uniref:hypothetical protein n=1 Tax=Nocardia sp. NPDC050799 TaxID=3154842 RepID=UPI00340FAEF9
MPGATIAVTDSVVTLAAISETHFVETIPDQGEYRDLIFLEPDTTGRFGLLHNSRAVPRIAS